MTDPVLPIPIDAIDAEALDELMSSIARTGLRMPIEVFELAEPEGPVAYGLISGFRRLAALRALNARALDKTRHATIPAFVRAPQSIAEAMTAMVEENAIRAGTSPWEQAMVAVTARDRAIFPTVEAAVDVLYASLSQARRKRLRAIAHLAEELDGCLTDPHTLSLRQLLRLASALTRGYGDIIRHALDEASLKDPAAQWQTLLPVLVEAETGDPIELRPRNYATRAPRPRRLLYPRPGVRIRRELTQVGWLLHVTGPEATSSFMDKVLDEIERWCAPG